MGNSSSHNVHHIHQPSTASSTLQPSMNHGYHQQNYHNNQQQQHHQSYPRNNRKPPFANSGFKVLPERVPGQKLRLTDNGSVLQNGGTISGRKIIGNNEIQPLQQPQYHHHQVHEDADLVRNLRRLSDISDERELQVPSPDMVSLTKRYNSHPDLLNDAPVSKSPVRRSHEVPQYEETPSRLVRKKSPKKGKAPVPPHEEGEVNRSSFMDARRAFANFLKANGPRKGEPHQQGFPSRSPDESDRPRMVVYPNPAQQLVNNGFPRNGANSNSNHPHTMEPLPKACFDEDGRFESPARGKSSPKTDSRSSNDHGKRIRSMDSLDASGDGQASFFLKHGELNKSVDSLHVTAMRDDPAASNQREIGRRASAASDSYFRRNVCGPPGRDESRPNGPDKWLFGRLLNSNREAALRHDAANPDQPLEQHSELNWKRGDHRIQRRESMGNHHNPFPKQQYFYGQGDTKVPNPGDASVGSLDRRQPLDAAKIHGSSSSLLQQKGGGYRQKDESPRGNFPKKEGTPRQGGSQQQQQLEEFSLREFGRREAALRRPSGEAHDGASSEDEMDINMNLRPTLPKRIPTIPRFSPTQVWRSLSLDDPEPIAVAGNHPVSSSGQRRRMSEHSSDDDDNEGDVFEDRIQRVARPVAPPRGSQEKSADSGISRDAGSPLPVVCDFEAVLRNVRPSPPPLLLLSGPHQDDGEKRGTWTPEEDLASDFDGGSGEGSVPVAAVQWPVREMVTAHPKLIPRRDMFAPRIPRPGESFTVDSVERRGGNGAVAGKARKAKAAAAAAASSSSNTTASTPEANGNSVGTAQTFNSVRKLKRSLSGVLGNGGSRGKSQSDVTNFDENWSLSRSLPNSLHNGQEGEKVSSGDVQSPRDRDTRQSQNPRQQVSHPPVSSSAALAAAIRADPSQQAFRVLPRSESGPIHSGRPSFPDGDHRLGRTEPELAAHRRPFTDLEGRSYADERQNARSGSAAASWWYSPREGHIVYLPEYDAKRLVEQSSDGVPDTQGHDGKLPPGWRKPKKFTYQSTVRQIERRQLDQKLSEEVAQKERLRDREMELVNKVEEEFQRKRDREKANIRQQLRILSMESDGKEPNGDVIPQDDVSPQRPRDSMLHGYDDPNQRRLEDTGPRSLPVMGFPDEDYDTASHRSMEKPQGNGGGGGGGFFSGIGKWMRRQQRLEKHQDRYPYQERQHQSRQEPEGAPHSGSTDSWENRRGELMDPRRQHFGFGSPGQRHSIAVDGGCSSDDRWPQHGASASDGGWRTEEYQHDQNHNRQQRHSRHQQQGKPVDEGFQSKRYGNSDKPSPGIHHRSQSFSQMWDEDAANRQSGTSSQLYPRSKSSSRPVPFGANSRGGQR